jgi:hypothetical protein
MSVIDRFVVLTGVVAFAAAVVIILIAAFFVPW